MINVTSSFLPPIEEYTKYIKRAYDNVWLTNRGELVLELEEKIKKFLKISNLTLTTNGTLPIQIAIKALNIQGEIITTPFSYIATTSSIVWENCTPVFVDIDPKYLTIDEAKIEEAITDKTEAILATHVFGNPCAVEEIQKLALKYNLKVIYDAAHCFGVKYKGKSIFDYGDVSTCSFHATKIFHTGEGGCFVSKDKKLHDKMYNHHNFGHKTAESFYGVGINAKMSELQAAMGLAVFDYFDDILKKRRELVDLYKASLYKVPLTLMTIRDHTTWNYHYFPVIFESEDKLLKAVQLLNNKNIFPRRYFYPSLNTVNYVKSVSMHISEDISKRVLCLPLHFNLSSQEVGSICNILIKAMQ